MKTVEIIEKENLSRINFSKEEVLKSDEDIRLRKSALDRAQTLGNLLQTKVHILFESKDGKLTEVHTTVWAVGEKFISLKGGTVIPIHRIHRVR